MAVAVAVAAVPMAVLLENRAMADTVEQLG